MKISVIGTGYVGLVSGVCLAEIGHEVMCVDVDADKVARIARGEAPIVEARLDELLRRNIGVRLRATMDLRGAIRDSELTIIAVGTPFNGETIDLSYIRNVSTQIGEALGDVDHYHVVVVKSTVVPGTTDDIVLPLLESASGKTAGADFGVGMNPEFLREGEAIADFMAPDRIVIGGIDARAQDVLARVYDTFDVPKIRTTNRTAEMIKYASNAFLATTISFTNEIANLSAAVGVDAMDVMHGLHLDRRLSPVMADGSRVVPGLLSYLSPGCGFGGSCFPKDVKALIAFGAERQVPMSLLSDVIEVNRQQPAQMLSRLARHYPSCTGVRIAVLGVAFKPGTDDIRESPAIPILDALRQSGASVGVYDPIASARLVEETGWSDLRVYDSLVEAVQDAAVIMLVTRWQEFAELPRLVSRNQLVIDGRRMLPKNIPCVYEGIGL